MGTIVAAMVLAVTGCSGGSRSSSTLVGLGGPSVGRGSAASAVATSPATLVSSPAGGGAGSDASAQAGSGYVSAALPAAVWTNPAAIPLDAAYHWPSPAAVARRATAPELTAVQDCRLTLSSDDKAELGAFPAAQADLSPGTGGTGGRDDWAAQETVLAAGDTSSGDIQGIYLLYTDLETLIGQCAKIAPGAKLTGVSSTRAGYAATISIPTSTGTTLTVHEYLAAPYGYLVELSVWVAPYRGEKASAAWAGAPPNAVLAALSAGPCALSKAC